MYKEDFKTALETSERLGLKTPEIKYSTEKILSRQPISKLSNALMEATLGKSLSIEELYMKCVYVHDLVEEPISRVYHTDVYYTIGYVMIDSDIYHKMSEGDLRSILENGLYNTSLNIHTWLTLPSMEIIDYVFLTNYFRANGITKHDGSVIAKHADLLTEGMRYVPTLIGKDFLKKANALAV